MIKWGVRAIFLVVLLAAGFFIWNRSHPKPEKIIRQQLLELARTASFSPGESAISKTSATLNLANMCTDDIEISVDVQGFERQSLSGKDELLQSAKAVRFYFRALKVDFVDINVALTPGQQSAEVSLTAKIQAPSEKEFFPQELKFTMKKVNGKWLIRKIETVRTLSLLGLDLTHSVGA